MKSCDEMVESLLGRRQEYIERQKRKSKIIAYTITYACCLCLVVSGVILCNSDVPVKTEPLPNTEQVGEEGVSYDSNKHIEQNTFDEYFEMADCVAVITVLDDVIGSEQYWFDGSKNKTDNFELAELWYSYSARKAEVKKIYKGDKSLKSLTYCENVIAGGELVKAFADKDPLEKGKTYFLFLKKTEDGVGYKQLENSGRFLIDYDINETDPIGDIKGRIFAFVN